VIHVSETSPVGKLTTLDGEAPSKPLIQDSLDSDEQFISEAEDLRKRLGIDL
jgi:hypothetical protein